MNSNGPTFVLITESMRQAHKVHMVQSFQLSTESLIIIMVNYFCFQINKNEEERDAFHIVFHHQFQFKSKSLRFKPDVGNKANEICKLK